MFHYLYILVYSCFVNKFNTIITSQIGHMQMDFRESLVLNSMNAIFVWHSPNLIAFFFFLKKKNNKLTKKSKSFIIKQTNVWRDWRRYLKLRDKTIYLYSAVAVRQTMLNFLKCFISKHKVFQWTLPCFICCPISKVGEKSEESERNRESLKHFVVSFITIYRS